MDSSGTDDLDALFDRLAASAFRRRFRLRPPERDYLQAKGFDTILQHAEQFIEQRIAPAEIPNDGKQTPMRNHPIFVAQHATATCCRGCLEKWHGIPRGACLDRRREDLHPLGAPSLARRPGGMLIQELARP